MEIRSLSIDDHDLFDAIADDVFDDPIDREKTAAVLNDSRHHLVAALEGNRVVGFGSAVHYLHPDKSVAELWINELGVARPYRRRGLGQSILHKLLAIGRELGCAEAWVLTERSNHAAMRLYQSIVDTEEDDAVMFTFKLGDA